ncbi:hypothetical protein QVD17_13356 [Tagetes erecta]|nr:hypothetical protein QVD17_13356 [Tagetes erecta]
MAEHSDDLDQLLDSALDDFQTLNLASSSQSSIVNKEEASSLPSGVQGLGLGLPDLRSKNKGKKKVAPKESNASETLNKLREQTRETVKGLESIAGLKPSGIDGLGDDKMMEDLVKQFEELAKSQDMESIVETMMQQLLSKEVLHEPMKEIGERYPKWLEDNKSKLSQEEYNRYFHQHELIKDLNVVYDTEPGNFNKIIELMQKMQECGQPPNDIVKELAPDFDISALGQLSPEMLDSQQNCCIIPVIIRSNYTHNVSIHLTYEPDSNPKIIVSHTSPFLDRYKFYLASQMANRAQIPTNNSALIAMIADEDTVTGFLLAGVGNVDLRRKTNYLIVDSKTTVKQIEDAFKEFTTRDDVAIVLISQYVANMIRFLVDSYNKPVPAILEIPSKDHPYDPAHDSVLSRVKYLFSTESVAGDRR